MEREKPQVNPQEEVVFSHDDPMRFVWDWHEQIMQNGFSWSVYKGLYNSVDEAHEWTATDPELTPEKFKEEGADIILNWMTTVKLAGISYEEAITMIYMKANVVIDRLIDADILSRNGAMDKLEAYKMLKTLEDQ